jgi:MYXO-CTERM domain-containing protein
MRFVVMVASVVAALTVFHSGAARAQNATTPGAVTTPYPTSQGIAIEWAITGDANNNGTVGVRYRESGATAWKTGMALSRVPAGANTTGSFGSGNGQWGNKHSGSLFDLDAGKTYEIELTLTDPDGGSMSTMTTASTRLIPVAAANAVTKMVTPSTFSSALSGAMPGDILLLGAGSYPAFTVSKNGSAGQPIVIRGASVDTVTIGGRVTMSDRQYVYLENVTVMGDVRMSGASNSVVRGCRIRSSSNGIEFQIGNGVPRNNTIVDNDVVGGAMWIDSMLSSDGYNGGEGIQFTGSGHVICFNHIKDFRDNISLMEYDEAYDQTSIDICNNDIEEATDDAIEADSAMGNVRIFRNRIRNCFDGISAQPDVGGPTYYVRNAMYNVLYTAFKFHNGTVGDIVAHNTVVKCGDALGIYAGETWKRAVFRNNVFIGGSGGGTYGGYDNGSGRIFQLADADASCSFDYDGVGAIGISGFSGKIGSTSFSSLATLKSNTTEAHAVQVDLSIFATPPAFPTNPYPPKPVADLRLAAGGAAVDKGVVIPGLDDDFAGTAPDLGAFEIGAALPTYGPRVGGVGSGTGGSTGSGTGGSPGTGTGGSVGTGRGGSSGGGTGGSVGTGRGGSSSSGTAGSAAGSSGSGIAGATGTATAGSSGTSTAGSSGGGLGGSSASGVAGTPGSGAGGSPATGGAGSGSGSGGAGSVGASGEEGRDLSGGCACSTAGGTSGGFGWVAMLAAAVVIRRRRGR